MGAKHIEEAARMWKYVFIASLFYLALIALFASEAYVSRMLERERQMMYSVMGQGPAGNAEGRASGWYRATVLDTGLAAASLRFVAPDPGGDTESSVARALAGPLHYVESRVRTMWLLLYQLLVRLSVTLMWWPYVVVIFVPVLIDAMTQRRIASTNFSTPSPTMHMFAKGLLWLFLIGSVCVLFAPLPLPPLLTPTLAMLGAAAMWISMTQFAKSA
ncbi:DUF4400 domain-containing protein (plasmid) [Xanthomonas citri pv. citri]|uniref:DUF4400 domain-containing protein n=1 Tax=Xanthomonas citri TaxID=346 RepID=UPI001931FAE6|nr:DUF4400 domain-containing protein [Xanthomonas citri]QRD62742.1 DUF4400 domain-containing protein [Xanthomonas citri pv. citri]QRD67069.1 DUF4400 domain-containing protein [Xanthomonas citri pv. citri]QRD71678.1 DUF4400 domain-containing protein [Xanthomonas citri pv. citri]